MEIRAGVTDVTRPGTAYPVDTPSIADIAVQCDECRRDLQRIAGLIAALESGTASVSSITIWDGSMEYGRRASGYVVPAPDGWEKAAGEIALAALKAEQERSAAILHRLRAELLQALGIEPAEG